LALVQPRWRFLEIRTFAIPSIDIAADLRLVSERLLREFRTELFSPAGEHGYADLRETHLHIFGNVGIDGIRLTDVANGAQLSPATTSELVSELERLGYFERRPDPADRRAKLVFPTTHGAATGRRHRQSCRRNRTTLKSVLTEQRFDDMCATMQGLLTALELQANGPDA